MADYYVNIFMDDEKQKKIEEAGLGEPRLGCGQQQKQQYFHVRFPAEAGSSRRRAFSPAARDSASTAPM